MKRGAAALAWSLWLAALAMTLAAVAIEPETLRAGITALVFPTVGALVASRRPENPVGWILCILGLTHGVERVGFHYATYALVTAPGSLPGGAVIAWIASWQFFVVITLFALLLLLFPDGRLPSPRWRPLLWAMAGDAGVFFGAAVFRPRVAEYTDLPTVAHPFSSPALEAAAQGVLLLGMFAMLAAWLPGAASLLVRMRRARGDERLQLKWVAYAATATVCVMVVQQATLRFADLGVVDVPGIAYQALDYASSLVIVGIPVAAGIAILRYRLYDIDLLINRTLVYGATSAAIALTFFGGILALQPLLLPLTGGSDLAIAVSTLASFALFQPIRRRVQDVVDRRFNRARYDAARTLDAFAVRLRDEVDLDSVRSDLITVIHQTIHPAHASVWLRKHQ